MLETYNTTDFVTGILDTLTVLETRAPLHVHVQVSFSWPKIYKLSQNIKTNVHYHELFFFVLEITFIIDLVQCLPSLSCGHYQKTYITLSL